MSSTSVTSTSLSQRETSWPLVSAKGWAWIGGLGVLFGLLHWNFIWRMVRIATGEWGSDWSHALIVPVISAYFIYQNSDRLRQTPRRVYWPGLLILILGIFSFAWCIYPVRNDMLQGYSMIVSLFGLVLFLLGPATMRVLWFPILYLSLAVKVSDRIWGQIAWELQLIAAKSATVALNMIGYFIEVEASVRGSTIEVLYQGELSPLNVAEACAGLRMLMAFIALGAAMAYLINRPWWHRVIMLSLTVPVAVFVNVGRVTALGLISLANKDAAAGDFHTLIGMLMLIPAAGLFWLVGWTLDQLVIRDSGSHQSQAPAGPHPDRPVFDAPIQGDGSASVTPVASGLLIGTLLTALIGVEYFLLLATLRPEDLFGGYLSSRVAAVMFGVGVVLLISSGWFVRHLVKPNLSAALRPKALALGLSAGVLLMGVVGLNGVVEATQTVLIKKEVPLRVALFRLPKQVGSWKLEKESPPLTDEMLEVLGTRQYISRQYRDLSRPEEQPGAFIDLHVAYYTGTPDTVPHVPDRCFVAGGLNPIGKTTSRLNLKTLQYRKEEDGTWTSVSRLQKDRVRLPSTEIQGTTFTFSSPRHPSIQHNVIYFFAANGKFLATPDAVRFQGFDPRDRYSYYCKIEVLLNSVSDPQEAAQRASAFLSAMMPEIMACLPDWREVTEGRWPKTGKK